MPRHDVAMTPAEVVAFVRDEDGGVLAHLDENGDPVAGLVSSRGAGTGLVLAAADTRRLPPDGTQVCVAYEREPSYSGVRAALVLGVVVDGRLEPDRTISFDFAKIPAPVQEDDH
ncbi:hypothetical protein PSU4_12050 [Pseudonocardia sulfidoxydans NBRC 16205]|uniref:Pyridoxamine 5'-phosphate oxidase putative domain-containing protein n=1 Tax=Pseudonocardia sulfidoxydans NBRC 16205 TaxID=1223511 RepID=A0A511DBT3_9PSEU|nr:hypothetical protein [Pseudonocardia sulfidoxydans]GEL22251.1 hypothetical protein PSU4_12050 [Pseudonocardia sulfidoxydans NBRC 16205]